jgi:hypothetical protein
MHDMCAKEMMFHRTDGSLAVTWPLQAIFPFVQTPTSHLNVALEGVNLGEGDNLIYSYGVSSDMMHICRPICLLKDYRSRKAHDKHGPVRQLPR